MGKQGIYSTFHDHHFNDLRIDDRSFTGLRGSELRDYVTDLNARIAALEAERVAAVALLDGTQTRLDHGCSSTTQFIFSTSLLSHGQASATVRLGRSLDQCPEVAEVFYSGQVSVGHALMMCNYLMKPPKNMPDDARGDCVRAMMVAAEGFLAETRAVETVIEKLRHIFEDDTLPDSDNTELNALTLSRTSSGRFHIDGDIDTLTGERFLTALSKFSMPQPGIDGTPDPRPAAQRRADALSQLLAVLLSHCNLGTESGQRPQVSVHVNLKDLSNNGVQYKQAQRRRAHDRQAHDRQAHDRQAHDDDHHSGAATTEASHRTTVDEDRDLAHTPWGGPLSIVLARLVGCDSSVTPIILDDHGVPLSVGRTQRTVTTAQRRALAARDGGCAFPTCTAPPAWCEGHHITHWVDGGNTDLDNLVYLCGAHHRLLHTTDWEVQIAGNRQPQFIPPASIDPTRTPRSKPNTRLLFVTKQRTTEHCVSTPRANRPQRSRQQATASAAPPEPAAPS